MGSHQPIGHFPECVPLESAFLIVQRNPSGLRQRRGVLWPGNFEYWVGTAQIVNGLWSTVITPTGVAGASLGMLAERAGPRLIWAITRFPHARCQLRPVVHRPSRFSLQIDAHSLLFMLVRELRAPGRIRTCAPGSGGRRSIP